jgi:hypothetical protein
MGLQASVHLGHMPWALTKEETGFHANSFVSFWRDVVFEWVYMNIKTDKEWPSELEGRKNCGEVMVGKKCIVDMLCGILTDLTIRYRLMGVQDGK